MGEVYKARDTRLARTVAIKVLPADTATDAAARARFEREARAIAALSHPHICVVHDVGHQDPSTGSGPGIDYLVMELLEGETLAERLARAKGPLPLDEVLKIGVAIADALDKAHRAGIVHRDLKPLNVMLTKSGPKLLDFGLAKLHGRGSPVSLSNETAATTVGPGTAKGTILGTIHYMSPEQVEGRDADTRSDIWALGALLYEMATGARPFEGESAASVIGAIMQGTPVALSTREPLTPPAFEHLVQRCLEKAPDERWQSASDLKGQLAFLRSRPTDLATVGGAQQMGRRSRPSRPHVDVPAVIRLELNLPPGVEVADSARSSICFSPQGERIAFVGASGGVRRLYVRNLNELEATALKGTETATICTFAPDGRTLGFSTSGGSFKTLTLADGLITSVLDDFHYENSASWGTDNRITFGRGGPLLQLAAGAQSQAGESPLTTLDASRAERFHAQPFPLPSAHGLLFTAVGAGTKTTTTIEAVDTLTRERHLVMENASNPYYVPTGQMLFLRDGALLGASFDAVRMQVTGPAVPLLDGVALDRLGNPLVAFSDNGYMAYVPGQQATKRLVWVSRQGVESSIIDQRRNYRNPRLSPDGQRIAVEVAGQVWVYDVARATLARLTAGQTIGNSFAVWSPDSRHIAYRTVTGIHVIDANTPADAVAIPGTTAADLPTSISPDGRVLTFVRQAGGSNGGIYTVPLTGQAAPRLVVRSSGYTGAAQLSPDGRLMAYVSDESGQFEVFVRGLGEGEQRAQISPAGGTHPLWSRDGRELFYRKDNQVLVVSVDAGAHLALSQPRPLFDQRYDFGTAQTIPNYDVSVDGQRFLMVKDDSGSGRINVVLNWAEELKARVASGQP